MERDDRLPVGTEQQDTAAPPLLDPPALLDSAPDEQGRQGGGELPPRRRGPPAPGCRHAGAVQEEEPPKTYRYDSSLSPALDWDGQNPARELGEWLIERIDAASRLEPPHLFAGPRRFGEVEIAGLQDAVARLKALSGPFLDWAGKAERLSFDVPTLPLFVHERLSTKAILETLSGHERDRQMELQLFADPQLPLHQQLDARGPGFDDFCAARKALIAAALNDMLRLSVDALTEEPLAADDVPEPEIGAWAEDAGGIPGV